jgi:hypothetical protein
MKKTLVLFVALFLGFLNFSVNAQVVDSLHIIVCENVDTTGFSAGLEIIKQQWIDEVLGGTPRISGVELHVKIEVINQTSSFNNVKDNESFNYWQMLVDRSAPGKYVVYTTYDTTGERSWTAHITESGTDGVGFWRAESFTTSTGLLAGMTAVHEMAHGFFYIMDNMYTIIDDDGQTYRSLMSGAQYNITPQMIPVNTNKARERYLARGATVGIYSTTPTPSDIAQQMLPKGDESLDINQNPIEFKWAAVSGADWYTFRIWKDGGNLADNTGVVIDSLVPAFTVDEVNQVVTVICSSSISNTVFAENEYYRWSVIGGNAFAEGTPVELSFQTNSLTAIGDDPFELPMEFALHQNYPNPFNPSTMIKVTVAKQGHYSLEVYNLLGELVSTLLNGDLNIGDTQVSFNGDNLASGIYISVFRGEGISLTRKMMLMK